MFGKAIAALLTPLVVVLRHRPQFNIPDAVILKNEPELPSFVPHGAPGRWTLDQAGQWYQNQPWLVGCNFTPASAINQLEMWQADTFSMKSSMPTVCCIVPRRCNSSGK